VSIFAAAFNGKIIPGDRGKKKGVMERILKKNPKNLK